MVLIDDKQLTEDYMLPDGTREFAADQGFGGNKIKNIKDPTDDQDGVNKRHMDNSFQSRDFKESARVGTVGDISGAVYNATGGPTSRGQFTGMPNTQDGVALAAADRVFVKDQTVGAQNGWYEVTTLGTGADGVWDRAKDFRKEKDVRDSACAFGFIEEGTQKETGWLLETNSPITIGGASGTPLSFIQFAAGGAIVLSVFGRTGAVVAVLNDYAASLVNNDSTVAGATVKDALEQLDSDISAAVEIPVADNNPIVKGSADATKLLRFEVDGLTTATTRVATMPDKNITLDDAADTRDPNAHASEHTDGTDDIQDATASQKGVATATQITKLDGIEAGAEVNDVASVHGRTGAVVSVLNDYDASEVNNDSGVTGATVKDALDQLATVTAVGPVPVKADKAGAPSATSGDGATTGIAITSTPSSDGYVLVQINGAQYELGDGVKTKDCYFSADGGATAKAIAAIAATDVLFWNGVVTGFDLATSDSVDLNYNVAA